MRFSFALVLIVPLLNQCDGRWLYFGSDDTVPVTTTTTSKPAMMTKRVDADPITVAQPLPIIYPSSGPTTNVPLGPSAPELSQEQKKFAERPPTAAESSSSYSSYLFGYVDDSAKYALRKVGNYVPIKSVASMAADLGIPGGEYVINALTFVPSEPSRTAYTPVVFGQQSSSREATSGVNPKFAMARSDTVEDPQTTTAAPLPSFREEVSSLMGSMYGEKECVKKLACLSGKRLSNIRGSWAITVGLTSVAGMMPESLQDPYNALKNSIMYTDDCSQYQCREEPNTDL